MSNMLIGQSGGPTVAINASLAGAVKRAMKHTEISEIYGMLNGMEGLLEQRVIDLRKSLRSLEDFQMLQATPAMALGSCRYKLPNQPDEVYSRILQIFRRFGIGYFFYIGGNDSMDTVKKLSACFREAGETICCVGIPKTIDNDLPCTDHTPGFGSAAKYIATSVAEIACDSAVYDQPSTTIVEIMGRNAGWLTAAAALARRPGCTAPHFIFLPEAVFDPDRFLERLQACALREKHVMIAVSEGVRLASGDYVASASDRTDVFGHSSLAGVGKYLEDLVREKIGGKVRSIELNVLQRSASHLYSGTDIKEARDLGGEAVEYAVQGASGVMVVMKRLSNHPYLIGYESAGVDHVANLERKVPTNWISADGCDVTDEMTEYLRPLILGEAKEFISDGVPLYFSFDKTLVTP